MTSHGRVAGAAVRATPLDLARIGTLVADDRTGATVTFSGVVRNHDRGRSVTGIEYVAHPSAAAVIAQVAADFAGRDGIHAVAIEHRIGQLQVGDLALAAAVSASHRAPAFAACADLIDRVKEVLPVWKRQIFADGTAEWTNCP